MKIALFIISLLSLVSISTWYLAKEDSSLQKKSKILNHKDINSLHILQEKFAKLDINSNDFDLEKSLIELKKARELYPLDDKLKMISIELNHLGANNSLKE